MYTWLDGPTDAQLDTTELNSDERREGLSPMRQLEFLLVTHWGSESDFSLLWPQDSCIESSRESGCISGRAVEQHLAWEDFPVLADLVRCHFSVFLQHPASPHLPQGEHQWALVTWVTYPNSFFFHRQYKFSPTNGQIPRYPCFLPYVGHNSLWTVRDSGTDQVERVQDLEPVSPTCSVVEAQDRQRDDSSSASGTWKSVSELLVIADQQPGVVGMGSYRGNCFNGGNSIMRESGLASWEWAARKRRSRKQKPYPWI